MSPNRTHFAILIADDAAAHERLLNTFRRRAPQGATWSFARDGEGAACYTLAFFATGGEAETLARQLEKLIDVLEVRTYDRSPCLSVETAMFRLSGGVEELRHAESVLRKWGGQALEIGEVELSGFISHRADRLEQALGELSTWGTLHVMRTGTLAFP